MVAGRLTDDAPVYLFVSGAQRFHDACGTVHRHALFIAGDQESDRTAMVWMLGNESLAGQDRKSTRLNSSHVAISYAVFCLKQKTKHNAQTRSRPPAHVRSR